MFLVVFFKNRVGQEAENEINHVKNKKKKQQTT